MLALALSAFAHADTTPSAAQLLLQALTPPTPVIPYNNSTVASTSPTGAPQASAGIASPFLLVSIPSLISPNASLVPQEAIVPGASSAATTPTTATAPTNVSTSTAALIQSLYAEVKTFEAEIAALEATSSTPSCAALTLTRPLDLGSTGSDVTALQRFLQSKGYYTYPSITGYFGPATEKAVAAFQNANGISSVGSVGPLTTAKIAALSASCSSSGGSSGSALLTSSATATSITSIVPSLTYGGGGEGGGGGAGGSGSSGGGRGGWSDTTPPSVSLTAPSSGATISGSSVTLTATASDNVAVANVQFKVDGTNIGSAITSSPYTTTWNSTGASDGSHTLYAVAEDTSGNYATSSISVTVRNNPPVISAISSGSPTTTSATITWTTDEAATSKVVYGATSAYGSATSSAGLVTSHSIGIIGLTASTTYHYAVISADIVGNTATSSDHTFTTASTGPDTTPPTAPTNLTAVASSSSELDLSWTASNDNGGGDSIAGYKIFRAGSQVGTTTSGTTYADTGLTASTTYTYTIKSYDAAGNVSTASNTASSTTGVWSDGFAAAPAGTAQFPTLLQGYAARAPWRVAGVDFYVGIPSGTTLTDWQSISQAGVSVNTSTGQISISGANVTLSGIDFSLHGGAYVYDTTNNGSLTITNSKLGPIPSGQTYAVHMQATNCNLTLTDDLFTGGAVGGGGVFVGYQCSGNLTAEYNYVTQGDSQFIEQVSGTDSVVIKWNLIYNMTTTATAHENWMQWGAIGAGTTADIEFNTGYQNQLFANAAGEGWQFYANNSGTLSTTTVTNNTSIATLYNAAVVMSYIQHGGTVSYGINTNNYFDITGAYGAYYPGSFTGWMGAQNYNMSTGASIVVAPLISSISSGTPGSATSTITWTTDEAANSKVVYGTTSAYGSATSSASFVTSHSIGLTGLSGSTTYHYAVVSTDGSGNSATSSDQTFTTGASGYSPPLDGIGTLSRAYSFWRLTTAYNGNLIRVTKISDSTFVDYPALANGTVDWSAISSQCGGSATTCYVTFYDQSGNGANTSPGGGTQVLIDPTNKWANTNGASSQNWLQFTGATTSQP